MKLLDTFSVIVKRHFLSGVLASIILHIICPVLKYLVGMVESLLRPFYCIRVTGPVTTDGLSVAYPICGVGSSPAFEYNPKSSSNDNREVIK